MIKKIKTIEKFGIFKDFRWDEHVKVGGDVEEFKSLNILYGRNYSGKTTLSRIFQGLEFKSLRDSIDTVKFEIEFKDGQIINQDQLEETQCDVRVFNSNFIKDNLKFLVDGEGGINAFAILNEKNVKIEDEISNIRKELGDETTKGSLISEWRIESDSYDSIRQQLDIKNGDLIDKLQKHANNEIKHNKIFGIATYNITRIREDINKIINNDIKLLSAEKVVELESLIKQESLDLLTQIKIPTLAFQDLFLKTKELVEKKISIHEPITTLLESPEIEKWVYDGIHLHKEKNECSFCSNPLPEGLFLKLQRHFNDATDNLRNEINILKNTLDSKINELKVQNQLKDELLFQDERLKYKSIIVTIEMLKLSVLESLEKLKNFLDKRLSSISKELICESIIDESNTLVDSYEGLNNLIKEHNEKLKNIDQKKKSAEENLLLNDVLKFINSINYNVLKNDIDNLEKKLLDKAQIVSTLKDAIGIKEKEINDLEAKLSDEKAAADKINQYLKSYFANSTLVLKLLKNEKYESSNFMVFRDNEKALNLSEGEKSLISFCYFIAKLNEINLSSKAILWIDDPISSLDSNHIFFVYSLIRAELFEKKCASQLFISTHNLEFLKYLRRVNKSDNGGKRDLVGYFVIERQITNSKIIPMPKFMKLFTTEFIYLFSTIEKCSKISSVKDADPSLIYNFGNNLRKFLEIYLAFKFPDPDEGDLKKLKRFLGEEDDSSDYSTLVIDRFNNESSHLSGFFEKANLIADVYEIQRISEFIVKRIGEIDEDQYKSLLQALLNESK